MSSTAVLPTKKKSVNVPRQACAEIFLDCAVQLGSRFLANGGPVTRLEGQLSLAGKALNLETSVTATPSSIAVYCFDRRKNKTYSRGRRIGDFSLDLGSLRYVDRLLEKLSSGRLTPVQVQICLAKMQQRSFPQHLGVHYLSVAGIGGGAALLTGGSIRDAMFAALFTPFIQWIVNVAQKRFEFQTVFRDFVSCFLAFFFSTFLAKFFSVEGNFLALGTVVYVVPGLLMTTAISEIVDQNYLSGSIRLLKAFYSFLSMALAFFLARDLMLAIDANSTHGSGVAALGPDSPLLRLAGSTLLIICSSIEFRAHEKTIVRILFCGLGGAVTYFLACRYLSPVLTTFCASWVIGFISFSLGRRYKDPSQIYSVPSILILAPGLIAFSSFGYANVSASGHGTGDFAIGAVVQALLISLAIVFGLAAGRLPFRNASQNASFSL